MYYKGTPPFIEIIVPASPNFYFYFILFYEELHYREGGDIYVDKY